MSAICGFVGHGDARSVDRMLRRMRHRGGVGTKRYATDHVAIGVTYGSSPYTTGAPAFRIEEGDVSCVFDGYLVNHAELRADLEARGVRLRTASHAEIVANLFRVHGERAFPLLDGSFTTALAHDGTAWVVRDPLGEKIAYFREGARGSLLFASEIKALVGEPGVRVEADLESLLRLLVFSFIPGQKTMFRGVSELEPGHFVRSDGHRTRLVRYWDLEERLDRRGDSKGEKRFTKRVADLSRRAVARRLPTGARIGVFLSGGVDSSAVVAILAEMRADVTAFSVAFGDEFPNELNYARKVAEHCGVRHEVIDVHPEGFLDLLPKVIWTLDDPLCDCITVPNYVLARTVAQSGCNVVFNGEGGDPLFGGPKNKFLILGEWYRFLGGNDRCQAYLASYHKFYEFLGAVCSPDLLRAGGGTGALEDLVRPYLYGNRLERFLNRLMYVNVKLKGGQNILVKVDKLLSANGMAVASPLFDRDLAQLSFEIPPVLKRRGDVEKYVFKKAVEPMLPRDVVYRKKAGMGVPLNQWFRHTSLLGYATDLLESRRARDRGLFSPSFVRGLLQGEGPENNVGQDRSGELLWMLMAIELWFRVFVDGEGA
jgi:asparagine synthase (glutamine-hydrolysing)